MFYDLCNGSLSLNVRYSCDEMNNSNDTNGDEDWAMERVVSTLVPVFFGLIGLAGLVGNALVILGELHIGNQSNENKLHFKIKNIKYIDICTTNVHY